MEDVVAKRMILNDMSYSTTADVLLTYRVWWKVRTPVSNSNIYVFPSFSHESYHLNVLENADLAHLKLGSKQLASTL